MQAEIFPCTDLAEKITKEVAAHSQKFTKATGQKPCLAVVLVGDDPASHVYVKKKTETCAKAFIDAKDYRLDAKIESKALEKIINELNDDKNIHGILVQSPLPKHLDERKIQSLIRPDKDVDGFHPESAGALLIDAKKCLAEGFPPCTPAGVMAVLKEKNISIRGKHAVVVGRSTIVGKPMALMLLAEDATVTICHSRTPNLEEECKRADILVAAVGKAHLINKLHVKKGAVVIDVGINRAMKNGKWVLAGDVNLDEISNLVALATPVPKGIGPMTIAMLLRNTLRAALRQHKLPLAL